MRDPYRQIAAARKDGSRRLVAIASHPRARYLRCTGTISNITVTRAGYLSECWRKCIMTVSEVMTFARKNLCALKRNRGGALHGQEGRFIPKYLLVDLPNRKPVRDVSASGTRYTYPHSYPQGIQSSYTAEAVCDPSSFDNFRNDLTAIQVAARSPNVPRSSTSQPCTNSPSTAAKNCCHVGTLGWETRFMVDGCQSGNSAFRPHT